MNTQDQEQQQDLLKTTEEQPPAVRGQDESETEECIHTKSTHLEEEEHNEMNIHTPDSTLPALKCRGNTSQESRGACVVEEATIRSGVHGRTFLNLTENRENKTAFIASTCSLLCLFNTKCHLKVKQ